MNAWLDQNITTRLKNKAVVSSEFRGVEGGGVPPPLSLKI